MIRLFFDNSKLGNTPRVFRGEDELHEVRSVEILPCRRCVVVTIDQPGHLDEGGELATTAVEDDYEVSVESAS